MKPIVITPGEPSGIGPDIVLQLAAEGFSTPCIAIASYSLMEQRALLLGLTINLIRVEPSQLKDPVAPSQFKNFPNELYVLDIPLSVKNRVGELDKNNSDYVIKTLDTAIDLATNNLASALVTGPVHKGIINEAGLAFTGHTEYLRDQSDCEEVVMMLATVGLKVALVTTHLPLKDVSTAITKEKIIRVTSILNQSLKSEFGCDNPNIIIAGLNPHAGEDGHLGNEELDTIIPALKTLKELGIETKGPLPADTLFQPHYLENADAVLAMYHDQGLPVLKFKGFGQAVNITLGLPFIRTSVDHGTALDMAGKGTANIGSLKVAINTAFEMAQNKGNVNA